MSDVLANALLRISTEQAGVSVSQESIANILVTSGEQPAASAPQEATRHCEDAGRPGSASVCGIAVSTEPAKEQGPSLAPEERPGSRFRPAELIRNHGRRTLAAVVALGMLWVWTQNGTDQESQNPLDDPLALDVDAMLSEFDSSTGPEQAPEEPGESADAETSLVIPQQTSDAVSSAAADRGSDSATSAVYPEVQSARPAVSSVVTSADSDRGTPVSSRTAVVPKSIRFTGRIEPLR